MTSKQTTALPTAEQEWRTAIEHAACCLACQTPAAMCETGEALLAAYSSAARQARSGDAG
ncbi:hypothetical protein [Streptomyces coffeae]|uniref:Uncharacterized protein n=1 Tax=Streptomyces coffeae TaxID=621382 RepID=A0ABS1NJ79_9ACTN|nr:hypothetical protein [Streptomyces coffeae]MBL1100161.1 hypothetical protein [Streptomyces coffeae]